MTPAVRAAAARLRIDSATAEVLRAFAGAGVQSIVLKGASNRQWLSDTPADGRWYADCDLLVRPQDRDAAVRVLSDIGFTPDFDAGQMPAWWLEHDHAFTRDDGAIIELHRTLPGVTVDDDRAWRLLSADAEEMVVGGHPAHALALPARAMHLAIHAAQHGEGWSLGLGDLTRAIDRTDDRTWLAAAALARELGATGAFVAGLRILPAGQALLGRLGMTTATSIDVALLRNESSALTVDRFVRASGLRTRLSMVRHKLVPPATYLRHWSPLARRGLLGLLLAYLWRLVWIMRRAPAAMRAWLAARRVGQT